MFSAKGNTWSHIENAMCYHQNSRSAYKKVTGNSKTLHIAVKKVKQFFEVVKKYKYKKLSVTCYLLIRKLDKQGAIQ